MELKPFYKSKTFWLGILQLSIAVAMGIEGQLATGVALSVSGVLSILLRSVTNSEITFR